MVAPKGVPAKVVEMAQEKFKRITEARDRLRAKLVEEAPVFVGSCNSEVYHYPNCSAVGRIKPENLQRYRGEPVGKRLHDGCPT